MSPAVIAILLLTLLLPVSAPARAGAEDATQNAERIAKLREQVAEVTGELKQAHAQKDIEVTALRETEQEISRLTAQLRQTENDILEVARRRQELLETLGPVEKRLDDQKMLLRRQVQASYQMGRQQRLRLLLNQDDPSRLSRILSYYNYLNHARAGLIQDIQQSYKTLLETGEKIREEEAALMALRAEQYALLASVEQARDKRKQALASWEQQIASADKRLDGLQQDVQRLQELTRKLTEVVVPPAVPESVAFKSRKGKLPWPVKGRMVQRFGETMKGGVTLEGIVIESHEGEDVRAVHGGEVIFADWLRGYGLLLIVDHGDGYMTLYGYNQSLLKNVGDPVEAGEIVSLAGVSGGRRNAAVYFAIRKGASPVNPLSWCVRPSGKRVG
ncbi:MAG: peptidoglycan DD-metalloendopeptidase family protein [Gammaproteobacteria bacterium]